MPQPPEYSDHQQWLGYVQPVGLVVSIPALLAAEAYVNRHIAPEHQAFLATLPRDEHDAIVPEIPDFRAFAESILGWEAGDLVAAPDELCVSLPAYNEVLSPTFAVPDAKSKDAAKPWLMVVQCLERGTDFDASAKHEGRQWEASPHSKLELLLQKTGVPIGLLFNHAQLRLIYKPPGENSGHITFSVPNMVEVAGRPIFAALRMLLAADRLFVLPEKQRLPQILAESRKYQNVVSTKLAEQVLAALYELVHGFQAADAQRHGDLLRDVLRDNPNQVYAGLLTVLLRLVFVLYAEDRDLLSRDDVYTRFYSLTGLFARLREDAGRYHDTMEQRYGAWAQLLVLFRMVYDGARHGKFQLPAREGYLFDPDRYPFLEGRPHKSRRAADEKLTVPHLSDGVVYRVLQNLLILDGERLSYRALDVEHIGGVYETMMGFNLEVAVGRSIAIKPTKSHGAPATINLDELLAQKPADRAKWLKEQSDQSLSGAAADALKGSRSPEDLLAALDKKIAREATPHIVPPGAMILQPSDERRRSGSHYTPRALTKPIVETTLRPVLRGLVGSEEWGVRSNIPGSPRPASGRGAGGEGPTPDQLLDLKICDPAMGSGAFLVEACRQLAATLVESWHNHHCVPQIPPDEDEEKHAMRIVAQRCLYGVDKNPLAVDLAKLSLWLATLAKEHPFTFLDHNLKHGDSLVGLTQRQIENFTWEDLNSRVPTSGKATKAKPKSTTKTYLFADPIKTKLRHVLGLRQKLLSAPENESYRLMRQRLEGIDENLQMARLTGDLIVAAFFSGEKEKQRQLALDDYARKLTRFFGDGRTPGEAIVKLELDAIARALGSGARSIEPLHWELEFPEVFLRDHGGFDAIVGNPPFAGKNTLINGNRAGYLDWLQALHAESHGNADLVAHFFRRAFSMLRLPATPSGNAATSSGNAECSSGAPATSSGNAATSSGTPEWSSGNAEWSSGTPASFSGAPEPRHGAPEWSSGTPESRRGTPESSREPENSPKLAPGAEKPIAGGGLAASGGCLGLIATNTIGQGDTRSTGLRWICTHGGTIYSARKRLKWPGQAAVVVSVVHLARGLFSSGPFCLDGRPVPFISAYLFHVGGHESPNKLLANASKSFQGSIVLGMGFTFDDTDSAGVANSLALMRELIAKDPRNAERVFPYIGGDETANSPTHSHHRYVINFGDMPLRRADVGVSWQSASIKQRQKLFQDGIVPRDYPDHVASDYPDLLSIVENKIKGHRGSHSTAQWWHFERLRKELYEVMPGLTRILAINCGATPWMGFTFLPMNCVYAHSLAIVTFETFDGFALLQSRIHEVWVRREASSMKDDLRYTPSDCFETFPFPAGVLEHAAEKNSSLATPHSSLPLESTGRDYYEFRAALMIEHDEGLTKTYNRFHDPGETAAAILRLRELHAALDRAVLEAYGWHDLAERATCEFLLDYEEEEEEDSAAPASRRAKKKPWRYRWPDDFRDEVLARLLELNAARAEQERLTGLAAAAQEKAPAKKRKSSKKAEGKKLPGME